MLVWALTFLAIAITAGVFGVDGIAATSVGMQVIFAGVLLLFAVSVTAGKLLRRNSPS